MREKYEQELAAAKKTHGKNQKAYRAASKARDKAELKVRTTCEQASKSANEVAALTRLLDSLPDDPVSAD